MQVIRFVVAVVAASATLLGAPVPISFAQPCPDVEVVFARGTGEPPGIGGIGQSFVDALRAQAGGRSIDVYAVNYAASGDFNDRIGFARTVVDGIRDGGQHVESTAATCPTTRIVLGGYSQGAAVAGFVTSAAIPDAVPAEYRPFIPNPMPPSVANHVAAVALFGMPSEQWMKNYGAPPVVIGPLYVAKTIQICDPGDTICNGDPGGGPTMAHALYGMNGMTNDAATFVANRL